MLILEILVTNCFLYDYQPVRRGTNGGVTKVGLLAAAAAGSVIGLSFVLMGFLTTRCEFDIALKQLLVIPISTLAGLCGSVIDSLLGATLQFSGFCTVRNKVSLDAFVVVLPSNIGIMQSFLSLSFVRDLILEISCPFVGRWEARTNS